MLSRFAAHCSYCDANLGSNEILAEWPVGKTFAFDPACNRLWIVCPRCFQWNISPLENAERETVITILDNHFARAPVAASGGLAMAEVAGTVILRIGDAGRREFAGWRYGKQLQARRKRSMIEHVVVGTVIGLSVDTLLLPLILAVDLWRTIRFRNRLAMRLKGPDGVRDVRGKHAIAARLVAEDGWCLLLPADQDTTTLRGDAAVEALADILPLVARMGATDRQLDDAIALIEEAGGPMQVFAHLARAPSRSRPNAGRLDKLKYHELLALEIAAHEDRERREFSGQAHVLGDDWKRAEQVARISDTL